MPTYDFLCSACNEIYEDLAPFDKTGEYPDVECPHCGSKEKTKLITACNYAFTNPVGTDRWTSDSGGHDYRFKYNQPNVRKEREMAEQMSHMDNPYTDNDDLEQYGEGIHDPETRGGLS